MKKFWNWIKNSDDTRILRLEGPIDEESFWGDEITPQMFRDELESGEGDVTVWINSPGGNVFAAAEIYTMLKDYKGSITVKIDAIAASAASVVAMAGDTVQMSPVAMLMIHDPSTVAMGNTKDMEKAIEVLTEVKESIINAYAAKSGLSHARIANLMSNETWMNAKKAVELPEADTETSGSQTSRLTAPANRKHHALLFGCDLTFFFLRLIGRSVGKAGEIFLPCVPMVSDLIGHNRTFLDRDPLIQFLDHQNTPSLTANRMERSVSISCLWSASSRCS